MNVNRKIIPIYHERTQTFASRFATERERRYRPNFALGKSTHFEAPATLRHQSPTPDLRGFVNL